MCQCGMPQLLEVKVECKHLIIWYLFAAAHNYMVFHWIGIYQWVLIWIDCFWCSFLQCLNCESHGILPKMHLLVLAKGELVCHLLKKWYSYPDLICLHPRYRRFSPNRPATRDSLPSLCVSERSLQGHQGGAGTHHHLPCPVSAQVCLYSTSLLAFLNDMTPLACACNNAYRFTTRPKNIEILCRLKRYPCKWSEKDLCLKFFCEQLSVATNSNEQIIWQLVSTRIEVDDKTFSHFTFSVHTSTEHKQPTSCMFVFKRCHSTN